VRTRLFYARKELAQMMRNEPALAAMSNWSGEGKVTIDDGEDESRRTSNTGHPTNGHPTNGRPTHGAKP
jgi:hypothetical protein